MEYIAVTEPSKDYELLDSGDGKKLERFGSVLLVRPDPQALWKKSLPESVWKDVSATFVQHGAKGKWNILKPIPEKWIASFGGVVATLEISSFKHIGIFPEQSVGWQWLEEHIKKSEKKISVLNLFGYTGGATLACALSGAEVTHVDSSRGALETAYKNRDASGLSAAPIRFILDDVRKFVEREIKRGKTYDVILLDPPVYGKGAKKEVWKIEEDLTPFLFRIQKLISKDPLAIVLNGYASGYSHITYKQLLQGVTQNLEGSLTSGELAIKESGAGRLLPAGIFARWEK